MDRKIVYPAQIPLVEDQLEQTRFIQKAFGFMAQALAGEGGTIATGLDCAPSSGMTVTVAPGQVITPAAVDSTSYGVLAEDTTSILTQFLLTDAATLTVPGAGATYLIYAAPSVADQSNLVLPFYNSANPTQVYAGPDNNGASSATVRASILTVGIGTSIPSGAVPLWQIVVPSGATAITSVMISAASGAPLYPSLAATAPRTLAPFNAALAADFGGYPLNAIVADASTSGLYWRSTVGGNTTVPGAAGSSWTNFLGGYAVLNGGNAFTGTQTVNGDLAVGVNSGWSGGTTTGSGRWVNGHIGFGSPDGNLETYTGYLQVTDLLGSPGDNYSGMNLYGYNYAGTRTDYTFAWNGKIITPLGTVAVTSDLPTSGTIAGGTYTQIGNVRRLAFVVSATDGTVVSFPMTFSAMPVISLTARHDGSSAGSIIANESGTTLTAAGLTIDLRVVNGGGGDASSSAGYTGTTQVYITAEGAA